MKIYKLFYSDEINDEEEMIDDLIYSDEDNKEEYEKALKNFAEKNKYKYKILYKNKIYPLQNLFQFKGDKINKLSIKLICYNRILDFNKKFDEFPLHGYFDFERLKNKKILICINILIIFFIHLMKYKN